VLPFSEQALEVIEANHPTMVITGLENRGIGGMELARTLRGNRGTEKIPLMVVSSAGGAEEWRALWSIGVQGFLLKPMVREIFVPMVRGLLPQVTAEPRRITQPLGPLLSRYRNRR